MWFSRGCNMLKGQDSSRTTSNLSHCVSTGYKCILILHSCWFKQTEWQNTSHKFPQIKAEEIQWFMKINCQGFQPKRYTRMTNWIKLFCSIKATSNVKSEWLCVTALLPMFEENNVGETVRKKQTWKRFYWFRMSHFAFQRFATVNLLNSLQSQLV